MAPDKAFQKQIQRIGELVEQLESATDPNGRAPAKELVELLMVLHGAGLERICQIAAEAGAPGNAILQKWGQDELVSSLLVLYGLHPDDLHTRVTRVLEKSRRQIESHGGSTELISIAENGAVRVRLHMKSTGCGSSAATVKSTLQAALEDAAPDAASIHIEETGGVTGSGFVPLAQLENSLGVDALSIAQPIAQSHGGGD